MIPIISIIIPVYNSEDYLTDCINSVIKQNNFENYELILVNDGSTDKSLEICESFSRIYSNICVISKQNGGVSSARYAGLLASKGKYISFIDNDDIISQHMYAELEKMCTDVDIVCISRINLKTEEIPNYHWEDEGTLIYLEKKDACNAIVCEKKLNYNAPLWGKLFRKDFLLEFDFEKYKSICPTIFMEDVLVSPMLFYAANKVIINTKVMYIHREISSSISRSNKLSSFYFEQIDSYDILLKFLKDKEIAKSYNYILNTYAKCLLRIWFKLKTDSRNAKRKKEYLKKIDYRFDCYKNEFLQKTNNGIKINCIVFNKSKEFWTYSLGLAYFKILRYLK
ncbi:MULTISPECIES: glycosyltransferase [unclassified Breznakia]|uniref:glycosyltransferase n=1 Tax=unclassified Breznakia TaxID=2623764 RepID=UPI0024751CD9|nr:MULTISPECIES: glycosyltransferase [unclassified Breznakia]MDH6366297.1 glycosyltransferase involved in cell wall biosynthesis [Breznakia sp. PH1-1]MDH6403390.1 glycosyltransferase involved in cell wall biosynthesis [Breznakia sp. PF1-11]MDH6411099.1 glycosyltransferase involved in cell wall biosynthesis [Breznakia sp. PFB1-11]MDH6413463.1 glycosyltransferase involved in cell wall biosynthesis [Breznakia sp. PFB1-14]MDH6416748.1 glycosyltransferase involved in cell wall biosynthesis [Breznak